VQNGQLSPTERFRRLFTDVRAGEGGTALLMFANVFLILAAYYLLKPMRESWIAVSAIAGFEKMEVKAYTSFGQSLLLVFVISWYSSLVNRWSRSKLITWVTLFCMSNMVVFWFLQPDFFIANLPWTGIAFYLWVGMFGVFVVAQFWAFAADVYDDDEGRRLIPMVAIGATAGAAFGAKIASFLVKGGFSDFLASFGNEQLADWGRRIFIEEAGLIIALFPLGASILLSRVVDRRRAQTAGAEPEPGPGEVEPKDDEGGGALSLIFSTRFLLAVAVITVILNWVNTNGENLLFRVLQSDLEARAAAQGITGEVALREFTKAQTNIFYGDFFSVVNTVALLLQAFVASRLLKYGGFAAVLLLLPVVALVSYSVMAVLPVLAVVQAMKVAENSTDYSINNTARHVLWLPVSSRVKFKGKPTIDSLFARIGDGMAALTVLVGVNVLGLSTRGYFVFTAALVLVWVVYGVIVVREHRALTEGAGLEEAASDAA
jgi:AAA family ATP:ADP antiporter